VVEREHSVALYIEVVAGCIETIEKGQMGWTARPGGQWE